MRSGPLWLAFAIALGGMGSPCSAGGIRGGIGVLGDSYSDEYQFYPPHRSKARNWVEILAETRQVDFGAFTATDRGTPRHAGYAYNWARSGATTADAIAEGQHTGLAAQVARGEVAAAWIFLGGNDFIEALRHGDPDAAFPTAAEQASAHLDRIIATLREARGDLPLLIATVPDVLEIPEFAAAQRDGRLPATRAAAIRTAVQSYNAHIRHLPQADPQVIVIDLFVSRNVARLLDPDGLRLAGRRIAGDPPGDDYDRLFLADGRHAGSVAQAMIARLFIAAVNARLNAGIAPLTDREILDYAAHVAAPAAELSQASTSAAAPVNSGQ